MGGGGVGLPKTDDRRENVYFWELFYRKSFHINFFVWFGMIYQWGYTRIMMAIKTIKNLILFEEVFFQKNVLINIAISGRTEEQKYMEKNILQISFSCHRRKGSWEKFFEFFGKNYQWGFTRMLEKSFHFIKIRFNENYFSWIVFERHFLSVGVQRNEDRKEKNIFWRKLVFTGICFP